MEMKTNWRDERRLVPKIRDATAGVPPGFCNAAFTLIELLVVIVIIAVLMGLAFPVFQSIQNQAKKTQAKNDVTQIVTAVNAFYTEYGKYPIGGSPDVALGSGGTITNDGLFTTLRGLNATTNPRQVVFISPPDAKDSTKPTSGISKTDNQFYDSWGSPYALAIDTDYDNQINPNPYGDNNGAGTSPLRQGVIAWSLGKDQSLGKNGDKKFTGSDDVISWQ
jgi:prepilin-type N-terminal cleavage/methylation domain-containing protein